MLSKAVKLHIWKNLNNVNFASCCLKLGILVFFFEKFNFSIKAKAGSEETIWQGDYYVTAADRPPDAHDFNFLRIQCPHNTHMRAYGGCAAAKFKNVG